MIRTFARLAIVAFAALAAAHPAAAQMDGSYELVEVEGNAMPAPSPGEDGVVVQRVVLQFMPGERFLMHARANINGSAEPVEEEIKGAYSLTDQALTLTPDDTERNGEMRFRFTLADHTLRLYNEEGHEYTFRRRQ